MCAFIIVLLLTAGQDPKPPMPKGTTLTILTPKRAEAIFVSESDRMVHIRMKTRRYVKEIFHSDDRVIRVYADAPPSPRDGIAFRPIKPGVCRVEMTDAVGTKEELVVVVEKGTADKESAEAKTRGPLVPDRIEAVVVVPEGNFVRLDIKSKKRIAEVVVSKNPVIKAYTGSGRDFLFEALRTGVTNVVMTDIDGTKDKVVVVVERKDDEHGAKK